MSPLKNEKSENEPIAYQAIASLDDSLRVVRKLTPILERLGYLCGLYGSTVVRGAGDDVDLLLVPFLPKCSYVEVIECLTVFHGFTPLDTHRTANHGMDVTGCVGVFTGVLVDLRISNYPRNGE